MGVDSLSLPRTGGREMRPAAQLLSFASPKESNQRKGDPTVCVPSLRFGQPAVLATGGVPLALASLRQTRALLPKPLLYAPAMRAFGGKKNRDCLSEASSSGSPSKARSAGCPKGRRQRGRLSFAYFSLAKQRKVSSRRATPGQQAQKNSTKIQTNNAHHPPVQRPAPVRGGPTKC